MFEPDVYMRIIPSTRNFTTLSSNQFKSTCVMLYAEQIMYFEWNMFILNAY